MTTRLSWWYALLMVFVAAILTILPLPHWASAIRPSWMLLVVLVWATLSRSISLSLVFVLGLYTDLLLGNLLGLHAFSFVVTAFLYTRYRERVVHFALPQQTVCLLLLVAVNWVLQWAWAAMLHINTPAWSNAFSIITTVVLWPWLMVFFQATRQQRSSQLTRV